MVMYRDYSRYLIHETSSINQLLVRLNPNIQFPSIQIQIRFKFRFHIYIFVIIININYFVEFSVDQ